MRTQDVKVGEQYLYKSELVTVLKRIKGRETVKRDMQSGEMFTGYIRTQKRFLLSNGFEVFADKLTTQQ